MLPLHWPEKKTMAGAESRSAGTTNKSQQLYKFMCISGVLHPGFCNLNS